MHEMSIAEMLLNIVLNEAHSHSISMIEKILVQIGEMAAVNSEALKFCFSVISKDTIAENAILDIEIVPIVARCQKCGLIFQVENFSFKCPDCDIITNDWISGREITVVSIEGIKD